ncbi:hypothetical protein DERP_012878 [Dermatophagoides pteronyssinus]|uniref:Uncharacterized protein n=1 Tax=Dermatophagoides pteronyssinus TaxID=6956 RepID=A0ABQ8J1K7_DERPT|nr:hypothetical protein DERP_012878 [Dermatophagoides pteronyssinus]
MFSFMSYIAAKITANDTMPSWIAAISFSMLYLSNACNAVLIASSCISSLISAFLTTAFLSPDIVFFKRLEC